MKEEWRDILGYEGYYQVSNYGHIRSLDRIVSSIRDGGVVSWRLRGKSLVLLPNYKGYFSVSLRKAGSKCTRPRVHRLVATTFLERPSEQHQVNHIDGNKQNNHISNLEWVTASENQRHMYRKLMRGTVKLSVPDVMEIKRLLKSGTMTGRSIAKIYNVCESTVSGIKTGYNWKGLEEVE